MAPSPPAQYYVNVAFPEEHGPQSTHVTQVKRDSSCRKGKEAKKDKKRRQEQKINCRKRSKMFQNCSKAGSLVCVYCRPRGRNHKKMESLGEN